MWHESAKACTFAEDLKTLTITGTHHTNVAFLSRCRKVTLKGGPLRARRERPVTNATSLR